MKSHNRTTYVVIEGIDGSGKTTQVDLLLHSLERKGKKVLCIHEPSKRKGSFGDYIRNKLIVEKNKNKYRTETISLAYAAERMLNFDEVVLPALNSKIYDFILSDRNFYSSVVYQSLFGADKEWIKCLNRFVLLPDMTIILDISKEEYMKRKGSTNIIFEKVELIDREREAYLSLPKEFPNHNIHIINGEGTEEEVHRRIINLLKKENFL